MPGQIMRMRVCFAFLAGSLTVLGAGQAGAAPETLAEDCRVAGPGVDVAVMPALAPTLAGLQSQLDAGTAALDTRADVPDPVVFAHRVTHGAPFGELGGWSPGTQFTFCGQAYTVTEVLVEDAPAAGELVYADRPNGALTLVTCHPAGSARQRLIVRALPDLMRKAVAAA